MTDPTKVVSLPQKSLPSRPPALPGADGELVWHPGKAPAPKAPFADRFYALLQHWVPWLAPNQGGGVVATVVLLIMLGVASNQGGIIESLAVWRWTGVPYWPTWILVGLGLLQLVYVGWSAHEQTAAENDRAAARYRQEVADYEIARGNDEQRRARDLQIGMLQIVVADQQAARETLPTKLLSLAFRDTARQVQVAVESARDPRLLPSTEGVLNFVDEAIRDVLWSILQFVRAYDQTVRPEVVAEAVYSANVMLHFLMSSTPEGTRRALDAELRCVEDGVSIDRLVGVLAIQPEWSAIAASDDREQPIQDYNVPRLVLPVPGWRVADATTALPGAPRAWQLGGDFLYYEDVHQLKELVLKDHCATTKVADAIETHFKLPALEHIRSFISTALVAPEDIGEGGSSVIGARPPIGVVNINCSTISLLREERSVGVEVAPNRHVLVIAPFLRALLYPLAGLIEYRRWVEQQELGGATPQNQMSASPSGGADDAVHAVETSVTPKEDQPDLDGVSIREARLHTDPLASATDSGHLGAGNSVPLVSGLPAAGPAPLNEPGVPDTPLDSPTGEQVVDPPQT